MPVKAKLAAPAAAPSPWDVLFGTAFTTDYELRGVSQSAHKPAVQGYFEVDYTATDWLKLYAGVWGSSLYTGFADAEFDISGGGRLTFGNFGLDLGFVYYEYPDGTANGFGSFGEFYAKPSYKVADWLTIGAVIDGGSNFNNKCLGWGCVGVWAGDADAGYYSGNAVITLPWHPVADVTLSINPEVGRQWFSSSVTSNTAAPWASKATPIGMSASTSTGRPSRLTCVTGTPTRAAALRWRQCGMRRRAGHPTMDACDTRFVATLKFDTSISALK